MAQQVIASRDVDIYLTFDAIGVAYKLKTGTTATINISGTTDDIHAISSAEAIATDNGENTYDISLGLQIAEAEDILSAIGTATANDEGGSKLHIRQIVEGASISTVFKKLRNTPQTAITKTYTNCTGVSADETVERSGTETITTWQFRARGMQRAETPIG